jgi:hypothetical protein
MKKYSQKELLNEGFWKGIGKVAGGVARGVDYTLGKVAPELQSLYKDPYKAAVGLGRAIKGSPSGEDKQGYTTNNTPQKTNYASPQETANIRQGLSSKNITLLNNPTLSYIDSRTRMKYFNVEIENQGRKMNIIVDSNGNYSNP